MIVAGRLWGAVVVNSMEPDSLPDDTEDRLADFTQLLATAIRGMPSRATCSRTSPSSRPRSGESRPWR